MSTICIHHWDIEPPSAPTSQGVCKKCKEERVFYNSRRFLADPKRQYGARGDYRAQKITARINHLHKSEERLGIVPSEVNINSNNEMSIVKEENIIMPIWLNVQCSSDTSKKKLVSQLCGAKGVMQCIMDTKINFFIQVSEAELNWVEKTAKSLNATVRAIDAPPQHEKALCGILTTSKKGHQANCKRCKPLLDHNRRIHHNGGGKVPAQPRGNHNNGTPKTIAVIHDLSANSMEGLVSLMKQRRDEAMTIFTNYDDSIKMLERIIDTEKSYLKAQQDLTESRKAIALILK